MALTNRMRLLDNASATGASGTGQTRGAGDGPLFNLMYPVLGACVQAEAIGGTTAYKILIMAKLDGATWATIATLDTGAGYTNGAMNQLTLPGPILEVKANLNSITGTGVSCYLVTWG